MPDFLIIASSTYRNLRKIKSKLLFDIQSSFLTPFQRSMPFWTFSKHLNTWVHPVRSGFLYGFLKQPNWYYMYHAEPSFLLNHMAWRSFHINLCRLNLLLYSMICHNMDKTIVYSLLMRIWDPSPTLCSASVQKQSCKLPVFTFKSCFSRINRVWEVEFPVIGYWMYSLN